jgi:hypothetical protein
MNDKESAIYATGYWNGIAYKRMRELTDEEIYAEMIKCIDEPEDGHTFRYIDFARAILRKASEK